MTNQTARSSKKERYANLIPMEELHSEKDRLFPFPIYDKLRRESPVRYDPLRDCWDVFKYDDVQFVLKNPKLFSSKRGIQTESILTMDPPKHTKLRALVSRAFTPKAVKQLETRIKDVTAFLLQEARQKSTIDIIEDFAGPLPVIIIAEMLGAPIEDRHLIKTYSDVLVAGAKDSSDKAVADMVHNRRDGHAFLSDYFRDILSKRRAEPKEDLMTMLLQAEIDGEYLTEEQLIGFCILLLVAGNETTTNLIANAVRYLTEDSVVQQQVRQNTDNVANVIEETLRYYSPVQAIGRVATEDTELGGVFIKKGSSVISWIASANRDEDKFCKPDCFKIDRPSYPHLSFGFGIHFCLGAPLARLEANIALSSLLSMSACIEKAAHDEKLEAIPSPFVFGVKRLPVRITFK
ncbi:cytochrome P450 [Bacillus spizizenii ATCC 6633 = JCM 2499]|uniref:Cytochrome P450 109 n=1 Tax=Bacillus spizizenii (strain ATCC 23059 / NRRL B-14472 / W23) TaxID=655816 RepID=CPXM_BACSH|nr:cytochrome P450 [Bacillus spizizenii]P27632.1 RecName: Full=Cytochrome P450 109; AltName: Full=ORF405 [Bacillus spizizenii str. W23]AAA22720.1 ORF 405 [Bacillus subtilis]ADM38013.1 putative monooxygenase (cytochrome P450) [Bacillus spizizenii str. W23]AJW87337.1 cytochrome P450 [Bacillus spizizenii]EFG93155.1 hypothetical protein BSU6633_05869 [Bacillus spizizenii ATCC 6633 = JCM 2499]KFK80033.1 cytochrome P450 family protein [Bacillus spizizenii]